MILFPCVPGGSRLARRLAGVAGNCYDKLRISGAGSTTCRVASLVAEFDERAIRVVVAREVIFEPGVIAGALVGAGERSLIDRHLEDRSSCSGK